MAAGKISTEIRREADPPHISQGESFREERSTTRMKRVKMRITKMARNQSWESFFSNRSMSLNDLASSISLSKSFVRISVGGFFLRIF